MSRGRQKLFSDLFDSEVTESTKYRRGRSAELIQKRNELLISRYYAHLYFPSKRRSYDTVMNDLEQEFALKTSRISAILSEQYPILVKITKAKPTAKDLKAQYPWMDWSFS